MPAVSGIVVTEGGPLLRRTTTRPDGRFALRLPPGHYTVFALIFGPASRPLANQPNARVVVRRGQPVHVRIVGAVL